MRNILNLRYWFYEPSYLNPVALKAMTLLFILMLIGAAVLAVWSKKGGYDRYRRKIFFKIASLLGWMGAVGFVLLFFRYEAVPLLARRFWYGLWLVGINIWVIFIIRYWRKDVPQKRQEQAEKARLKKYLP